MKTFYLQFGARDKEGNGQSQGWWWERRYFIDSFMHADAECCQVIDAESWIDARRQVRVELN